MRLDQYDPLILFLALIGLITISVTICMVLWVIFSITMFELSSYSY